MPEHYRQKTLSAKEQFESILTVAHSFSDKKYKVVPGKSWQCHYPNQTQRTQLLNNLLAGKTRAADIKPDSIKPDGFTFDATEIELLELDGVIGKVRNFRTNLDLFNYSQFLQFLEGMQGKEIDLQSAEKLYENILKGRNRKLLMDSLGRTGQEQMKKSIRGEIEQTLKNFEQLSCTEQIQNVLQAEALKNNPVIMPPETLEAMNRKLGEEEKTLLEALKTPYTHYVEEGRDEIFKNLVEQLRDKIADLKKLEEEEALDEFVDQILEENPENMPDEVREELEKMFNDVSPPPQDECAPDFQDTISPSMDEMKKGKEGEKITPFYTVEPPLLGFFQGPLYSKFDQKNMKWRATPGTEPVTTFGTNKKHTASGQIRPNGFIPVYIPDNYTISGKPGKRLQLFGNPLAGYFLRNTKNKPLKFAIPFGPDQVSKKEDGDIKKYLKEVIAGPVSKQTAEFLDSIKTLNRVERAQAISYYMKNILKLRYSNEEKYNLIYKRNPGQYLLEIEKHKKVDCDVAQTYAIALCRKTNVPAGLLPGHRIDGLDNEGKAVMYEGTLHAKSRVLDDNNYWHNIDFTPIGEPENKQTDKQKPAEKADDKDIQTAGQKKDEGQPDQPDEDQSSARQSSGEQDSSVKQSGEQSEEQTEEQSGEQTGEQDSSNSTQAGEQETAGKNSTDVSRDEDQNPPSEQLGDDFKEKMKELKEKLEKQEKGAKQDEEKKEDGAEGVSDEEWEKQNKELQEMREKKERMEKEQEELRKQFQEANSFQDLKKLQDKLNESELFDEDKKNLQNKMEAQKEQMKNEIKNEIAKIARDGFMDDKRKEELLKKLEEGDELDKLENIQESLKEESEDYNEFLRIEKEVEPLVNKWYRYFVRELPKLDDIVYDEDSVSRKGIVDRRALNVPHNLLFGTVHNPRIIESGKEPRFIAILSLDVSDSMKDDKKLEKAKRLLVFYCKLFSKVSEEYGYIPSAITVFSTSVEEIKTFTQNYAAKKKYRFSDGTSSTIKARIVKKVKASGGTDMGKAIWHANHALNEEKKKFKDYLTALYVISDGQTGGELSGEKLKQFLNGQIAYWGEWWGKHIKAGILLGKKENRNILEQYFGADNTIVVDDLNRLIQEHVIRFAQDVKRYVKKLRL